MEPTGPEITHPAKPGRSQPSSTCRAYYSDYEHPEGASAWASEQSLWEQLTKLAHSDDWDRVYRYCAPYVADLFSNGAPGNTPAPTSGVGNGPATSGSSPAN
jgi:hypothetical protein